MTRILVLGNAGLDICLTLPHLPRPGETLVAERTTRAPGGKGLNQAVVAARAGGHTIFAAPVGADLDADTIATALQAEPFATLHLPRLPQPTDLSILMVAPDGENSIVTIGACAAALNTDAAACFAAAAEPGDLLLLQGNLSEAASLAAARTATMRGARLMVNAAPLLWPQAALLDLASYVVVNAVEAACITGQENEAAAAALRMQGAAVAIVTLGAAGCVAADAAGTRRHSARPAVAIDSSGAGDVFCGMLAAMVAAGASTDSAIDAAQVAASLCVARPGVFAALPTASELVTIANAMPRV
jgi:ribokinase